MSTLILASSSPFRRGVLERLGLPFEVRVPDVDESRRGNEAPEGLVQRLAEAKARAAGAGCADCFVIGSDQVAVFDDQILGKPGNHEAAMAQLRAASGREVIFLTGLYLLNTRTGTGQLAVEPFRVVFRDLNDDQIDRYLRREQPYNCAGSFKSEGLGIALFERLEGDDPTALIGLPLIRLVRMLEREGVRVI